MVVFLYLTESKTLQQELCQHTHFRLIDNIIRMLCNFSVYRKCQNPLLAENCLLLNTICLAKRDNKADVIAWSLIEKR